MTLTPRLHRSLQALVLACLGLFLLHKIWSGTLSWYINQRFMLLVALAAIGFLALARVVLPPLPNAAEAGEHDHAPHDHQPGPGRGAAWALLLAALPVLLGVLVPARPLGSSAVATRGINASVPLTLGADRGAAAVSLSLAPTERSVLDWVRAFNDAADPHTLDGEPASVVGFVYHDARLPADQFLVSRFAVTCCSADAVAVGMLVRWAGAAALESSAWVRVAGPVEAGRFAGRPTPLIAAEAVEGVTAPEQPYLYP